MAPRWEEEEGGVCANIDGFGRGGNLAVYTHKTIIVRSIVNS